jgi:hypothetical protein
MSCSRGLEYEAFHSTDFWSASDIPEHLKEYILDGCCKISCLSLKLNFFPFVEDGEELEESSLFIEICFDNLVN